MKRFSYAFHGMLVLIRKDHKFSLHLLLALIVIIAGFTFKINETEWLFIIISIGLVLAFEAINTAVEYVVDLVTSDYHVLAKKAKDVAAFSVVLASLVALVIGLIIFLPYVFK
ncbi:diacylglycerol kinase family protein [Staphylococcus pseudoxylosus]|uniref:Diacylglycerol kinase family protein n=1 Tax=Staphylococcus pseudoxylosus TaxID=2282419 RepID=A0AAQ0MK49_9STAP|nr:diacylglycerol kinase family protein [Staphylococcus pseudoxylosus]PTI81263.1 diacylglycerol kinase [Staphylococcus xylosus]MCE5001960.1 diacylglycerol kinase family protein [Staphylococcus pseudoxylosus]MEB5783822.1 diacylglycerol kinase family protein [Staphylococcus pseudoxylosus]MEB6169310.1 diacylglycerol kinase family protein [Staphylococcus pseudoxylosus]MEB6332604.1 diacylglycerol kinase family protein [Staphylococcus pseudoxylosus]